VNQAHALLSVRPRVEIPNPFQFMKISEMAGFPTAAAPKSKGRAWFTPCRDPGEDDHFDLVERLIERAKYRRRG